MDLRRQGIEALRELARRRPVAVEPDGVSAEQAALHLRAIYYDKQRMLFGRDPTRRKRATKKTRRAGATAGGVREFLARGLEQPGFRATYVTTSRGEARSRAWRNDAKSGLVNLLEKEAELVDHPTLTAYRIGGVTIEVRDGDLVLDLSNGSQIELFGADNIRRHRVKRGDAKHVIWIDEAQDFPHIEEFYSGPVVGSLTDTQGECWMTGTPGKDLAGMFYEITKEEEDERLPGWDVHVIAGTDNPFFGAVHREGDLLWVVDNMGVRTGPYDDEARAEAAAIDVRWANTAELAKAENHWTGDEPDFIREQLGRWVKGDARYVYPIQSLPKHQQHFAPQRLADNPLVSTDPRFDGHPRWYDHHAAVADLPRPKRGHSHQWLYSLGVDFGYHPDPFAMVLWAFTPALPDVFEMFSWKCTRVHTDDQAQYMRLLWDAVDSIVSFVGDPAGKQDDFEVWRTRMNLPIEEANKKGKNTLEEFLANDIRRGRIHLREGSPLYLEMKHLVYLPGKPGKTREVHKNRSVGGVIHGDHCADGARYSYADLTHYLAKLPKDKPAPDSKEHWQAEAEREERGVESKEARRAAELMDRDEEVQTYGGDGYSWE